jgi:polyisoprenoid-binding protein YceI
MSIATSTLDLTQTTGTWAIDPAHSRIGFSARHAMVTTVRGSFESFEGQLHLDGQNPSAATAGLSVQTASIATGSADRDTHVRSADFLNVEEFPTMTFAATQVRQTGDDTFVMVGDLTIRGTTRPVEIDAVLEGVSADPFGNDRIGFSGRTVIRRKDFGLVWNVALETGGVLVSDKVTIELDVSAIKQA